MFMLTERDIRRFQGSIDKRHWTQCWPWIGMKSPSGYGRFTLANGKNGGRKVVASRIACFLAYGPAPEDKPHALHRCDNPPCCNPHHLYWGNRLDNVHDAIARGRHSPPPLNASYRKANPRRGEASPQAKLTDDTVREIWQLHLQGKTASEIAALVNQSVAAVYDVARGRSWRHLRDAPSVEALRNGGVRRGAFHQFLNGNVTGQNQGSRHGLAKLTESQVLVIRKATGSHSAIAAQFNISRSVVTDIINHRTWRHLP